ncbi:hypothetical protein GALMADRAFT_743282 [Galerina marginata CBS 339.88]|uniref:F-box domain-containing protein n=1 Tax=Galerina marginata (strain CBS 339.88) TaxID=685588 RepID=A0A067T1V4_GALM3|nr:hypothetical protein GALMADRAFT_743282 [Galerina marginata CBS 339.88]
MAADTFISSTNQCQIDWGESRPVQTGSGRYLQGSSFYIQRRTHGAEISTTGVCILSVDFHFPLASSFSFSRDQNLARRVRFLYINPTAKFLPVSNKGLSTSPFRRTLLLAIVHIRSRAAAFKNSLVDPSFEVLKIAKKAVKNCRNADEIEIILGDQEITLSFVSFTNSLWRRDSVGPNVKKISLMTTFANLSLLLNPLVDLASTLTNLCTFNLQLHTPGFEHTSAQWNGAMKALVSFFTAFKDALTSVGLYFTVFQDRGRLFEKLPHLPNLRELSFFAPVNYETFPSTESLTHFFSKHASELEVLTITTDSPWKLVRWRHDLYLCFSKVLQHHYFYISSTTTNPKNLIFGYDMYT